jgi:nucleoside-diphosphate-sugar epimerase
MKILVTGATGYLGSAIAERLRNSKAKHEVSGLARSAESAAKLAAAGITPVRGDFADPASVADAARVADGVVSTATASDPAVDVPAIDAILGALAGTDKPFVYTSSIWIYGNTGDTMIDELTPVNPPEFSAWRVAVDDRVRKASRAGLRSIVIRPTIVYGRGGGIPADLVESARVRGAARYVGTGKNWWPFVHVDDLADLYLLAVEHAPGGLLFIASSGASQRVENVAAAASRGAGTEGRTESWSLEEARKELGSYADGLVLDQQASGKRAEQMLGWRPERPSVLAELEHGSYVTEAHA